MWNLEETWGARGPLAMVLSEAPTSESFFLLLLFVTTAIEYACLQYLDRGGHNQLRLATVLS